MHYVYRGAGGDGRFVRCGGAEGCDRARCGRRFMCIGLELPSPPSCSCVCVVAACAVFELFDAWGRGQRSVAADDEAIVESIYARMLIQLKSDNGYLSVH